MVEHIAEILTALAYFPAGLMFGYLIHLPITGNVVLSRTYSQTQYGPFILMILSMLISTAVVNGLKLHYRKYKFVHFYVIFVAMLFNILGGIGFIFLEEVAPVIFLSVVGLGLVLVPGLSYINIRARKAFRSFYLSLCYVSYLIGVACTSTIFLSKAYIFMQYSSVYQKVHLEFGIAMTASAGIIIILISVNELLHRKGISDYKKPMDYDVAVAHDNGNFVFRQTNVLDLDVRKGGGDASRILLEPNNGKNFHGFWVLYMILTKLKGFITFYWVIAQLSVICAATLFNANYPIYGHFVFWCLVLGSIFGTCLTLVINNKISFILSSILHIAALIICIVFYNWDVMQDMNGRYKMSVAFVLFYTFIGVSYATPDINILEISPIKFSESMLAIGFILEILAIGLLQYFSIMYPSLMGGSLTTSSHVEVIRNHFGTMIVLSALLIVAVLLHMPNNFKKSLVEIQDQMRQMTSYTVMQSAPVLRTIPEPLPYIPSTSYGINELPNQRTQIQTPTIKPKETEISYEYGNVPASVRVPRAHLSTSPLNNMYNVK